MVYEKLSFRQKNYEIEVLTLTPIQNNTSSTSVTSGSRFTPYISPLRHFKAYRYHPGFTEDVSNGFRSLTYSHDIDAMKYFCPYELAGGVCNDRSCEFQHFRDITLSGASTT